MGKMKSVHAYKTLWTLIQIARTIQIKINIICNLQQFHFIQSICLNLYIESFINGNVFRKKKTLFYFYFSMCVYDLPRVGRYIKPVMYFCCFKHINRYSHHHHQYKHTYTHTLLVHTMLYIGIDIKSKFISIKRYKKRKKNHIKICLYSNSKKKPIASNRKAINSTSKRFFFRANSKTHTLNRTYSSFIFT